MSNLNQNRNKPLRKDWPKVRRYVKSGNTYYRLDLRREHYHGKQKTMQFTDKEEALAEAAKLATQVAQSGLSSIADIEDSTKLKAWGEQVGAYGKTLEQAIQVALEVFEKEKIVKESPFMAELLTVWVDDKKTGLKKLRADTLESIRDQANLFKAHFGMARIKEIDSERIEDYLKGKDVSDQTRLNNCSYLQQFFNWAIRKGHFKGENPASHVKKEIVVERSAPKFFKIEECEKLLKTAQLPEHRQMLPYIVLGFFAGIRPEEVERMTWEKNIKLATKQIDLEASITKTKKDRNIEMPENLVKWLEYCSDVRPLVPTTNMKNLRVRLAKEAKVKWIADGLRHSFATYFYAKDQKDGGRNFETLRSIMGNSPGIIDRFYKGSIHKSETDKFWNLTPGTSSPTPPTSTASAPIPLKNASL